MASQTRSGRTVRRTARYVEEQWRLEDEQRRRPRTRRLQREPNDEQLLIEGGDEEIEVEEDEFGNEEEVGNIEGDGPDDLDPPEDPLVQEAQGQGGAVLQVVGRRVRGAEDEQGDVASRLHPTIPGPCEGDHLWTRTAGAKLIASVPGSAR